MIDMQKYPKGEVALRAFVRELLQGFQDAMKEQIGGESPVIEDSYVAQVTPQILEGNPRMLYDFFDNRGIFLTVYKEASVWYYSTGDHDIVGGADRKETELKGFDKAFAELELKLD